MSSSLAEKVAVLSASSGIPADSLERMVASFYVVNPSLTDAQVVQILEKVIAHRNKGAGTPKPATPH